jgi:hypothetical protein
MTSVFTSLAKLAQLSWSERRLLCTSLLALPASWMALRLLGFNRLRNLLNTPGSERSRNRNPIRDLEARSVARMVRLAAEHGIFHANCLEQSLTLAWLLRRRGIQTELRIGAQRREGEFAAHAWLEMDGVTLNETADVAEHFSPFDAPAR